GLTAAGRRILALGAHPRLPALVLGARDWPERVLCGAARALGESRVVLHGYRGDDWHSRWLVLHESRRKRSGSAQDSSAVPEQAGVSRSTLRSVAQAADNWRRRLRCTAHTEAVGAHHLGDLLLHAWPDRIAR